MGRTVKHVPQDFDWPLDTVWKGYLNPHYKPCPHCEEGYTVGGTWFGSWTRLLLLAVPASRSRRRLHPYLTNPGVTLPLPISRGLVQLTEGLTDGALQRADHYFGKDVKTAMKKVVAAAGLDPDTWGIEADDAQTPAYKWLTYLGEILLPAGVTASHEYRAALSHIPTEGSPRRRPSPEMVKLSAGLAGREPDEWLGHDSSDAYRAGQNIVKAAGLDPDVWGICPLCKGEAVDPAVKEAYEAWEEEEPPTGEGYQLWGTTNEGSPQSPVFEALDELCLWCEEHATTFGSYTASAAEWKRMLSNDMVYHQEGNAIFL